MANKDDKKSKYEAIGSGAIPINNGYFSSNTNEWATPQKVFDKLNEEFAFTLDPCASKNNAKCRKYYTKEDDGLLQDWSNEIVFMNPPYGRKKAFGLKRHIQKV